MSMQNYPIRAYGLLVYAEELQSWWDSQTEGYGEKDFEQEEVVLADVPECLPNGGYATVVYAADGEADIIDENGFAAECIKDDISDKDFVILELNKHPSLYKAAYKDRAAAMAELKATYAEVLPEDFDFESRFVCYMGTEFG